MRVVPLDSPGTKSMSIAATRGDKTMIESRGSVSISASHRAVEHEEQDADNHGYGVVLRLSSLEASQDLCATQRSPAPPVDRTIDDVSVCPGDALRRREQAAAPGPCPEPCPRVRSDEVLSTGGSADALSVQNSVGDSREGQPEAAMPTGVRWKAMVPPQSAPTKYPCILSHSEEREREHGAPITAVRRAHALRLPMASRRTR